MYHLRIEIPGLPSLQSGSFGHWSDRRKHDKRWRQLVGWETLGKRPGKPLARAFVVCTRYSATSTAPDDDNLRASFKPLIDGLVGDRNDPTDPTSILADDSPKHMTAEYHWEMCLRGGDGIVMEVSEVGER